MSAMKDALKKRRGRGLDISILIAPEKDMDDVAQNPKDGLSPDVKEEPMNDDMATKQEVMKGMCADGEAYAMDETKAPNNLRERMMLMLKKK